MNLNEYLVEIRKRKSIGDRCLYRGQPNSNWRLESGATRRLNLANSGSNPEVYENVYLYYHRQLIETARRMTYFIEAEPTISDMQLLANLQHFGAGTGLLDFSWDSLLALWFVVSDRKYKKFDGNVFFISDTDIRTANLTPTYENISSDELLSMQFDSDTDKVNDQKSRESVELSHFKYLIWEPPVLGDAGSRIFAQRSVFLIGRPNIDEEDVEKIVIPAESKDRLLKELEEVDVTERSVFRDLSGFAKREGPTIPYQRNKRANFHLKQGNDEYRNKRLQYAMAAYTLCIDIIGDESEELLKPLFYRAHVCSDLGRNKKAYYNQANSDYSSILSILAQLYGLGTKDVPDEYYQLLILCHFNRGNVRSQIELFDKAIEDFGVVENLNKDLVNTLYYNWGNTLFMQDKFDEAISKYDQHVGQIEHYADRLKNQALTCVVRGEWSIAEYFFRLVERYGDLPKHTLESVLDLRSKIESHDEREFKRKSIVRDGPICVVTFSHPEFDQNPVFVPFTGVVGLAGNRGWGEMSGGRGFPGSVPILLRLGEHTETLSITHTE